MSETGFGGLAALLGLGLVLMGTPILATSRGRNWKLWLLLTFCFSFIATIILLLLPSARRPKTGTARSSETETIISHNKNVTKGGLDVQRYIRADDDGVSAIIVYTVQEREDKSIVLGAYYGSVGGGELDGGYFRIDSEGGEQLALSYDEMESLQEESPADHETLEKLMQKLWELVEDEEGDLQLTDIGRKVYFPDEDGVWMDAEFDGDALSEVSEQWAINTRFES